MSFTLNPTIHHYSFFSPSNVSFNITHCSTLKRTILNWNRYTFSLVCESIYIYYWRKENRSRRSRIRTTITSKWWNIGKGKEKPLGGKRREKGEVAFPLSNFRNIYTDRLCRLTGDTPADALMRFQRPNTRGEQRNERLDIRSFTLSLSLTRR